jgi:hypothetical protein
MEVGLAVSVVWATALGMQEKAKYKPVRHEKKMLLGLCITFCMETSSSAKFLFRSKTDDRLRLLR